MLMAEDSAIRNNAARDLTNLGPSLEQIVCDRRQLERPEIFLKSYLAQMLTERPTANGLSPIADWSGQFSEARIRLAAMLLLRYLLIGKPCQARKQVSYLRRECERLTISLLQAVSGADAEIYRADHEVIKFIHENVAWPPPEMQKKTERKEAKVTKQEIEHRLAPLKRGKRVALPKKDQDITRAGTLASGVDFAKLRQQYFEEMESRQFKDSGGFGKAALPHEAKAEEKSEVEVEFARKLAVTKSKSIKVPTAKIAAIQSKKAAGYWLKLLFLPLYLGIYLGKGVWLVGRRLGQWLAKIPGWWGRMAAHFKSKAQEQGIQIFELFLGDDAGRPGPVERLAAQSRLVLQALQVTMGLRFVLLANAIDNFLDMIVGYVQNIFRTWKMMKAARRRIYRQLQNNQIQCMEKDFAQLRLQLSRLFCFAGFYWEEWRLLAPPGSCWEENLAPTFPLQLVLQCRSRLDELKEDMDFVTIDQMFELARRTSGDLLRSLIPNPLDWLAVWKDWLLLALCQKYSRSEIEIMYGKLLQYYRQIISILASQSDELSLAAIASDCPYRKLMVYEQKLLQQLPPLSATPDQTDLACWVEKNRRGLQRLIQVLCNCQRFIDPRYWSRHDLLREISEMQQQQRVHPQYSLEWERWLTPVVSQALATKGMHCSQQENGLRQQEQKEFRWRYRWQRRLGYQFTIS